MIRPYRPGDLDRLKELTALCFGGVSIDRNIEDRFGRIGGRDWTWRKLRHIDADVAGGNAESVFVWDDGTGRVMGYITGRTDPETRIGWIPNMAVHPDAQGQGIGRRLMEHLLDHFRERGMEVARIETLEQNPVGSHLYPSVGFVEVARQRHFAMRL